MIKVLKRLSTLQYLGLLGFLNNLIDQPALRYLWLFFLFGLIDIVLNPFVFVQSLAQLMGMIVAPIKHGFHMPSPHHTQSLHYQLPFKGAFTVVNGGITRKSSHSWSIQSQRYAYDFIILDDKGLSHEGEGTSFTDYYCYGQAVVAPADGKVISVVNHYPDSPLLGSGMASCKARDIRGNHLIIQHGPHEFSLLAHLKPQSISVGIGDRVTAGQVLARCGNSGNTSEPHLHFHLQDSPNFYTSAGLPITFDHIKIDPAPHYEKYDSRPIPSFNPLENPHSISRGYLVQNVKTSDCQ